MPDPGSKASSKAGSKTASNTLPRTPERLDRFVRLLSHELRNPMMAVVTAAENIVQSDDTNEIAAAKAVISRQAAQVARILEDLLDMTRIGDDSFELTLELIDLRTLASKALHRVDTAIRASSTVVDHALGDEPLMVFGDVARLTQAMVNLLRNAIRHTPSGGTVELAMTRRDDRVEISVSDSGAGIAESELEAIFEPFYRGRDVTSAGMGLGLCLVRSIATAHNGSACAHSLGPGTGSRFVIDLPLRTTAAPNGGKGSAGGRLLLVEDQDDNREMLAMVLERAGYDVLQADSVKAARAVASTSTFDAAIIDIGLPDGTGHDVAGAIRDLHGATTYLIALTGHGRPTDRDAIIAAGFDVHLVKPVESAVLRRVLDGLNVDT